MPRVRVGTGIELHFTESGSGPPLLLIPGLGYWHWCWFKQVPELSRHFRVIALDNRGVGGSDAPDEPYTIPLMATEAADALAALGLGRAHVLGTSMGGFIAQELALAHPERVDRLVLVCTSCGGPDHLAPPLARLAVLQPDPALSRADNLRRAMSIAAAPGYWQAHAAEQDEIIGMRLQRPVPVDAYLRQLAAVPAWAGARARLAALATPTLVIHGDRDLVVPVENADRLAAAIPGARLRLLPGAGHLCFIEQAAAFNAAVTDFLH